MADNIIGDLKKYGKAEIRWPNKGRIWNCYDVAKTLKVALGENIEIDTIGDTSHDFDAPISGCRFRISDREIDLEEYLNSSDEIFEPWKYL